jgi:mercuric ion transport protein
MNETTSTRLPIITGLLAAFGASACCVGPLVLVTLGLSGAWISGLHALEPLQPLFIAVAIGFLLLAFYRLYIKPRRCEPGQACAIPAVLRKQRIAFWVAVVSVKALLLFPFYAHWFY